MHEGVFYIQNILVIVSFTITSSLSTVINEYNLFRKNIKNPIRKTNGKFLNNKIYFILHPLILRQK